jgi:hypothetical protein
MVGPGTLINSEIQELRFQIQELQGSVAGNHNPPTVAVSVSNCLQVSQPTTNHSIMGGRNEQDTHRRAATVVTKQHVRASTAANLRPWTDPLVNTVADNECNTNKDTCCSGKNFIVLHSTYGTADVYAYDSSIQPIENLPIVTAATAYDNTVTCLQ